MSERPTSWQRSEEIGLAAVGVAAVVYAGWFEYVALGFGEVTSVDMDLRVLAGAVGVATAVAGALAVLRVREDVVGAVLRRAHCRRFHARCDVAAAADLRLARDVPGCDLRLIAARFPRVPARLRSAEGAAE